MAQSVHAAKIFRKPGSLFGSSGYTAKGDPMRSFFLSRKKIGAVRPGDLFENRACRRTHRDFRRSPIFGDLATQQDEPIGKIKIVPTQGYDCPVTHACCKGQADTGSACLILLFIECG